MPWKSPFQLSNKNAWNSKQLNSFTSLTQTTEEHLFFTSKTEREPVRPCNFHTVVIGGFVAHTGPFQLKWWLWFLYRPKMVLLVVVTPKYVGFGYYVGDMPHKFINQKPKNSKKTKKTKETKKTNPLEETLGHNISPKTLVFLVSLVFLIFFEFFVSFPSPVADESFRV